MTDASLLERARSALGRALRLTRAYGHELDVPAEILLCDPLLERHAPLQQATRPEGACQCSQHADSSGPSNTDNSLQSAAASPHTDLPADNSGCSLQADGCDSDQHATSSHNWWEEADRSSSSSSDCLNMQPNPDTYQCQPSLDLRDSADLSNEICSLDEKPEGSQLPAAELHESGIMVDPSLGSRASSGGGDAHRSTLMLDQAGANRTSQPVSEIAERLGAVQRQQADTVGQLLQLRQVRPCKKLQQTAWHCPLHQHFVGLPSTCSGQGWTATHVMGHPCLFSRDSCVCALYMVRSANLARSALACGLGSISSGYSGGGEHADTVQYKLIGWRPGDSPHNCMYR